MNVQDTNDRNIILEVLDKLNIEYINHKYFTDGASSKVILLNDYYLIKQNEPQVLQAEYIFLKHNTSKYFQKILYFDPEFKFVVYEFISGNTMKKVSNPEKIIHELLLITSNYSNYLGNGFGYLNEEVESFSKFLSDEIIYSSKNLENHIPDNSIAFKCTKILEKYPFEKKLLHGDFGTHNFIEKDNKFVGIIDPMPVIGDPLYDILFAISSNIDLLNSITLEELYLLLKEPTKKVNAMFVIVLYSRMSRCLKYHPQDFNIYFNLWNKLINLI